MMRDSAAPPADRAAPRPDPISDETTAGREPPPRDPRPCRRHPAPSDGKGRSFHSFHQCSLQPKYDRPDPSRCPANTWVHAINTQMQLSSPPRRSDISCARREGCRKGWTKWRWPLWPRTRTGGPGSEERCGHARGRVPSRLNAPFTHSCYAFGRGVPKDLCGRAAKGASCWHLTSWWTSWFDCSTRTP